MLDEYSTGTQDGYKRDVEETHAESLVSAGYKHSEKLVEQFSKLTIELVQRYFDDFKRDVKGMLERVEGSIKDTKFNKKISIWIVIISAVSLGVAIFGTFFAGK